MAAAAPAPALMAAMTAMVALDMVVVGEGGGEVVACEGGC